MKITRQIAWLAAVGAMVSVQFGATQAKALFSVVGATGATALRIGIAALLMLAVFRPRVRALATTPLGVCVTVEFVGPLSLALILSRRPLDFLWTALAVAGVALIVPWWRNVGDVPLGGVLLAAAAGVGWAFYILATNHVTQIVRATDAAMVCVIVASVGSTLSK